MKVRIPSAIRSGNRARRVAGFAALLVANGLIGLIDYITGSYASMGTIYLLPVLAAGWWLGFSGAVTAVALASSVWLGVELHVQPDNLFLTTLWNGFSRLMTFAFAGLATAQLRADRDVLTGMNRRLSDLLRRETALARTDSLTGLANRRAFLEILDKRNAVTPFSPFGILYLDLDRFKALNDRYGHEAGDQALQAMADILGEELRAEDLAARLGGDEFAVILDGCSAESLGEIERRLVARVDLLSARWPEAVLGVSVGACWCELPSSASVALQTADGAMYRTKRTGWKVLDRL